MSVFYFTDSSGNYYELSSTTRVSVSEPSRTTTNPVESGKAVTDNYVIEPRIITFSGVITNITVIGQDTNRVRPVDQWLDDIRKIRLKKDFVNVYIEDLNIIPNCLITSFDIDKTKEHGLSGWGCSFSMQEILVSDRARLVDFPTPKDSVKEDVSKKRNSGNQTTEGLDNLEEVSLTITNLKRLGVG